MRAAIERGKRRVHGAPTEGADLALDHDATFGKYEVRAIPATFVLLRAVLISGGGLCQFLLILRLVILGLVIPGAGSRCAATGRCSGRSAHGLDESPPRRSRSRHGCSSLARFAS